MTTITYKDKQTGRKLKTSNAFNMAQVRRNKDKYEVLKEETVKDIKNMTVEALKAYASEKGIDLQKECLKGDIINIITKAESKTAEDGNNDGGGKSE